MKKINMEDWPRRESFEYFNSYVSPLFNVCAQPEITPTFDYIEERGLSKFTAVLWLISCAANSVPEIRLRIRGNEVVTHDIVHPSFAVMTEDKTLAFCAVSYTDDIPKFFNDVETGIARVKANPNLIDKPGADDLLFVSCVPWINFTSITHPVKNDWTDNIPRISWGKLTRENGKVTMPVSLQLHHGLADGYHAGLFFEKLEDLIARPEALSWPK